VRELLARIMSGAAGAGATGDDNGGPKGPLTMNSLIDHIKATNMTLIKTLKEQNDFLSAFAKGAKEGAKADKAEKKQKKKELKDSKAKRVSAYNMFAQDQIAVMKTQNPSAQQKDIMKDVGGKWKTLTDKDREPWVKKAAEQNSKAEAEFKAKSGAAVASSSSSSSSSSKYIKDEQQDEDEDDDEPLPPVHDKPKKRKHDEDGEGGGGGEKKKKKKKDKHREREEFDE